MEGPAVGGGGGAKAGAEDVEALPGVAGDDAGAGASLRFLARRSFSAARRDVPSSLLDPPSCAC